MSSNNASKRENIEQIPKDNLGEVQKAVSEQGGVEGQRKEVNVGDYIKTAAVGQLLKGLEFRADKNKIVQFVQQQQERPTNISEERKQDLLNTLQEKLEEGKQYQNVSQVTTAAELVRQ